MKTFKRDRTDRAYSHGCHAGSVGHELESCPYFNSVQRAAWMQGWREGREIYIWIYKNVNLREQAVLSNIENHIQAEYL